MDVRAALEGCAELHAEMVRANGNPLLWQTIVSIFAFLESLSQLKTQCRKIDESLQQVKDDRAELIARILISVEGMPNAIPTAFNTRVS